MSLFVSVLTGGDNSHETTAEEVNAVATDFISEGVVGAITNTSDVAPMTGAFAVNEQDTPAMAVDVSAGVAYVTGTPTGGSSQTVRVKSTAEEEVTISANSTGSTKYDWIYIKLDPDKLADPAVDASDVATLVTSRSTSSSSDDGTPPTYGYPIAVVTVANGENAIEDSMIADVRIKSGWFGGLNDTNGNEVVKTVTTSNAVNEVTVTNAATGNAPEIAATGGDTNIDLDLAPKGTGEVTKNGNPIDWWEEIGRTTLGSASDTITVSSLPARTHLKVIVTLKDTGGSIGGNMSFNGDSGANYAFAYSIDSAAKTASASSTGIFGRAGTQACAHRYEAEIYNIASDEKPVHLYGVCNNAAGAATVPSYIEVWAKWANTTDAISSITYTNTTGTTGDFAVGSEMVVLGHN